MCGLIAKCAVLIVLIHIFRAIGRCAGPRFSGLALGLPSTTAVVLIFCGCEHGSGAATAMAESSLLGLVAAVSLPLAFSRSVRQGWPLWRVVAASVGGYMLVAATLACLPAIGALAKVFVAAAALFGAARWVGRSQRPETPDRCVRVQLSRFQTMFLRTATPVLYVVLLGMFERLAGPGWAGLFSTFPSLSLMVLVVTYLEAGPAESSRVAQVLPCGNSSTLAFLAMFRLVCFDAGVGWATLAGYGAAVAALLVIQRCARLVELVREGAAFIHPAGALGRNMLRSAAEAPPWLRGLHVRLPGAHVPVAPRNHVRPRLVHRRDFAPLVETLAW
jgi:hypothetical protein